ncbi:BRO family protein [Xenorhabdus griffiniae]|uniref:BRO-N domain-containing protein n=1 Tax=Xenorhabdus griffiniae TaxID=351672 RepID=UPI0030D109FA
MSSIAISKTNNTNQLTFRSTAFNPVSHANKIWFTAVELAKALEYKKSDAVTQIYERNSDEFTPAMTETLKMRVSGNYQKTVRVFSLRGAHLIAIFSKTSVAKEFRKWVLDILDREVEKGNIDLSSELRNANALYKNLMHLKDAWDTLNPHLSVLTPDIAHAFNGAFSNVSGPVLALKNGLERKIAC